jgi:hypothetical protein
MYSQEVNLDKATVLTTIFTIVDDVMKASPAIQAALRRPGHKPCLSDSEVVTIALYQELIGEPREDHFFRLHQASLLPFFPGLNERSRYNRRKRDLWSVTLAVRMALLIALGANETLYIKVNPHVTIAPLCSPHAFQKLTSYVPPLSHTARTMVSSLRATAQVATV